MVMVYRGGVCSLRRGRRGPDANLRSTAEVLGCRIVKGACMVNTRQELLSS